MVETCLGACFLVVGLIGMVRRPPMVGPTSSFFSKILCSVEKYSKYMWNLLFDNLCSWYTHFLLFRGMLIVFLRCKIMSFLLSIWVMDGNATVTVFCPRDSAAMGSTSLSYSKWAAAETTLVQVHKSRTDGFKVACVFAKGRHFLFFEVRC
jgi:hypothetical protein